MPVINWKMMKKLYFFLLITVITGTVSLFFSCRNKSSSGETEILSENLNSGTTVFHTWYYFTSDSFEKTDLPQNAPEVLLKPWTESVRISSAGCAAGTSGSIPAAYAVVNRLGVLILNGSSIQLSKDRELFSETTAGRLVFSNDIPVYSFFKSYFFNNTTLNDNHHAVPMRPFLAELKPDTAMSYPIISYENLGLPENAEITGYIWSGKKFLFTVKQIQGERTLFSYYSLTLREPLSSFTVQKNIKPEDISPATAEEYRAMQEPLPFDRAPAGLKKPLSALPADFICSIECSSAGGTSPVLYSHGKAADSFNGISAKACTSPSWVAAVFSDGTTYFAGSLYGRPILSEGKTIALKLPKLPDGYSYGSFTITGTTLYAAWEETSFYNNGRNGFISVDLDKLLYKKGKSR